MSQDASELVKERYEELAATTTQREELKKKKS